MDWNIILAICGDALFAAVAAIGFGAVSHPARRAFKWIALLGALGHALRFVLMNNGVDIASSSFIAAFAIGMGSVWPSARERIPMTCLYIPALLPMIPGIYAYKSVLSLIRFMQSLSDAESGVSCMNDFLLNVTVTFSVVFLLAVGATIPLFLFRRKAISMTRARR